MQNFFVDKVRDTKLTVLIIRHIGIVNILSIILVTNLIIKLCYIMRYCCHAHHKFYSKIVYVACIS